MKDGDLHIASKIQKCATHGILFSSLPRNVGLIFWVSAVGDHITFGTDGGQRSRKKISCRPSVLTTYDMHIRVGGVNFVGNVSGLTVNGRRFFLRILKYPISNIKAPVRWEGINRHHFLPVSLKNFSVPVAK